MRRLILFFLVGLIFEFSAPLCRAQMQRLDNHAMADIRGTGGLSVAIHHLAVYMHTDRIGYTDTDTGNGLELGDVTLSNGDSGPATFSAGESDVNGDGDISPLTVDLETVSDAASPINGKTMIRVTALDWLQEVAVHADTFRFCDQDLGSLDMGVIRQPSFSLLLGAHDSGIDFEFDTRLSIDTLGLTYNSQGDQFAFSGIHFASQATGTVEDPGTWQLSGMFQLGAMADGTPATFDVGKGTDGLAAVSLNLPMSGSVRVEAVQWGGENFGPIALDGIQVHRLSVRFTP